MTIVQPTSTTVLDATGLQCPLPVLKARKVLKALEAGSILEVLATDPSAVGDFAAYCESSGYTLVDWSEEAGVYKFRLRK